MYRCREKSSMSTAAIVFKSTHRVQFSDLDLYHHVTTAKYAAYYVDHRMQCLRDYIGWDLKTMAALPFMVWMRRIEIDYIRPIQPDQEITITSFVRELRGPDAIIDCTMADAGGKILSRCVMTVAYVDKQTNRAIDWPPEHAALFFEKETA
jgi:acyl-CoA thioester hydrolase